MPLEETRAKAGFKAQCHVSDDGGVAFVPIQEFDTISWNDSKGQIAADSSKFQRRKQTVPDRASGDATVKANLLRTGDDPGMAKLRNAYTKDLRSVRLKVLSDLVVGDPRFDIVGYVTSAPIALGGSQIQMVTCNFYINGISETTVTQQDIDEHGPLGEDG